MSISKMMMRRTENEIANANGFLLISFPFFSLSVFQFSNISLAAVFIVFTSFFNKRKNSFSFPHFPVALGEFTLRPKVEFNSAKELCNFKTNCLHLCTRERERVRKLLQLIIGRDSQLCSVLCISLGVGKLKLQQQWKTIKQFAAAVWLTELYFSFLFTSEKFSWIHSISSRTYLFRISSLSTSLSSLCNSPINFKWSKTNKIRTLFY